MENAGAEPVSKGAMIMTRRAQRVSMGAPEFKNVNDIKDKDVLRTEAGNVYATASAVRGCIIK